MGHDAEYLKSVVGEVLSEGVAATLMAKPYDPVDHLGHWLLEYVSTELKATHVKREYQLDLEKQRAEEERRQAERRGLEEAAEKKERAIAQLAQQVEDGAVTDIYTLWSLVVEAVTSWTAINAACVALLLPLSETTNAVLPDETTEEDVEGDENLFSAADEPEADDPETQEEENGEEKSEEAVQERMETMEIVAAANESQRFLLFKRLCRPASQEEADGSQSAPLAPAFKLVEECLEELYVRYCVDEGGITFLSGQPKIGSCYLCPLGLPNAVAAIVICDTLSPPGDGSPISDLDRSFIKKLADVTSHLMAQLAPPPLHSKEERKIWLDSLRREIQDIQKEAAESEDNTEETDSEIETAEEVDEEQKAAQEEVKALSLEIKEMKATSRKDNTALEREQTIFSLIKDKIHADHQRFLEYLQKVTQPTPQTLHLIQTAFVILGLEEKSAGAWSAQRETVLTHLFPTIANFDVSTQADTNVWKRTRIAISPYRSDHKKFVTVLDWCLLLFAKQACNLHRSLQNKLCTEQSLREKEEILESKRTNTSPEETPAEQAEA